MLAIFVQLLFPSRNDLLKMILSNRVTVISPGTSLYSSHRTLQVCNSTHFRRSTGFTAGEREKIWCQSYKMCISCKALPAFAPAVALEASIWAETLQEQHALWSYPTHQLRELRADTQVQVEPRWETFIPLLTSFSLKGRHQLASSRRYAFCTTQAGSFSLWKSQVNLTAWQQPQ